MTSYIFHGNHKISTGKIRKGLGNHEEANRIKIYISEGKPMKPQIKHRKGAKITLPLHYSHWSTHNIMMKFKI